MDEKARWSIRRINDLPDSAFLYIEPGGEKDEENKTTPRYLRHFPYKNENGNIDLPHLRGVISNIPQAKDKNGRPFSRSLIDRLQGEARAILERENEKSFDQYTPAEIARTISQNILHKLIS